MTKLDFYQRKELSKILLLATDEDDLSEAISQLIHDRDASQRLLVEVSKVTNYNLCDWTVDGEGTWRTGCDNLFQFEVDGPHENHFKFCPYCGKPLEAAHAPD